MKKLTETMKQMLDALALADAGEYLSGREKSRILSQRSGTIERAPATPEPARVRAGSSARRVALYLGSELPPEVIDYVIETCLRLRHELTVLTFESESTGRALLEPHKQALEAANVDMEMVRLSGEPVSGLRRYLRGHPEVAFLACKDAGYLGRSYLNGTHSKNTLPVPVVVVTTAAEGSGTQGQPAAEENGRGAVVA
jgi:hypothetical protein